MRKKIFIYKKYLYILNSRKSDLFIDYLLIKTIFILIINLDLIKYYISNKIEKPFKYHLSFFFQYKKYQLKLILFLKNIYIYIKY